MSYLFDSDVCIDLLRNQNANVVGAIGKIMDRIGALDCLTSVVVESELAVGAFKAPNRDTMFEKLDALLGRFSVLPIDREIARKYAEIRASLERRGTTIGSHDAYIAATALTRDLTLLTRNLREFGRVEGLRVETV